MIGLSMKKSDLVKTMYEVVGNKPAVRNSETPMVVDVDETLIGKTKSAEGAVFETMVEFNYYGQKVRAKPLQKHIEFIKACHSRGYEITVWSANGYRWAEEVVNKLKLNKYVHYIATKPLIYVDDKDANSWMKRVFID